MYLGYTLLDREIIPEARKYLEEKFNKRTKSIPKPTITWASSPRKRTRNQRAIPSCLRRQIELALYIPLPTPVSAPVICGLKNYPLAQQELELSVKLQPE